VLRSPCRFPTAAISRARERVGGDAGGSEAAFSSMASDRASGIRRRHSTKVVARLSFGRAAPTRAQLIPFVSRCYGSIAAWAMRGRFDVRGGQIVESSHLYLGLMAEGKRPGLLPSTGGRAALVNPERGCAYPQTRALGRNGAASRGNEATAPVASCANRLISVRRDGDDSPLAA
jgi:hypothetical protein